MSEPRLSWMEVESKVKGMIVNKLGVDSKQVTLDANFTNDLGADSLDTVEMVMEAEKIFNIQIPDELAEEMQTMGDAIRLFVERFPREALSRIQMRVLRISLRTDGTIQVIMQMEDGSWTYADGKTVLPSSLCLIGFSRWASILKDLELLINNPKTKEADLQKFFEEYPELIAGDDYDEIIPQASIRPLDGSLGWRADFVLTPHNPVEFAKVLELKMPSVQLTKRPQSGHITFGAKVWAAIRQLKDYGEAFDSPQVRERFKTKYGTDVFQPDLHLIAGRRWDINWIDSIHRLRKDTPVKIEDWDSVLDRLKREFV